MNFPAGLWVTICFFLSLIFMTPLDSMAAFERMGIGADVCGMSIIGVSQIDPLFIPFTNPAAEPGREGWSFSTFYSRRYNMRDLAHMSLSFSATGGKILWSLGGEKFGNDVYSEELAVLGMGFPVTGRTRIGYAVKFYRLRIQGYGEAITPGFDAAWFSSPIENIQFGAVWRGLNRPELGTSSVKVPSGLIVGLGGSFTDRVMWTVEGNRTIVTGEGIGFGFVFTVSRPLKVRMGYRRGIGEYSLGTTLHLSLFRWDYAFSFHPVLGTSHYFTLSLGNRFLPLSFP
jgi:hypothetical protein